MAEDNDKEQPEQEINNEQEPDDLFRKMSSIEPPRDEDLEGEDLDRDEEEGETLEERIASGRKLTDFQTLSLVLNPPFGFPHLDLVTKGRTFPDTFNPLRNIFIKDFVRRGVMSVPEAIAFVNTALSISIDGEGRLDNIHSYTKGHQETTEQQNKGLGLAQ